MPHPREPKSRNITTNPKGQTTQQEPLPSNPTNPTTELHRSAKHPTKKKQRNKLAPIYEEIPPCPQGKTRENKARTNQKSSPTVARRRGREKINPNQREKMRMEQANDTKTRRK